MPNATYNDLVQSFSPSYYFKLDNAIWPVVNSGSISSTIAQGNSYSVWTANSTGIVDKCASTISTTNAQSYFYSTETTSLFSGNWTFSAWVKFNATTSCGGNIVALHNDQSGASLRQLTVYANITSGIIALGYQHNVGTSGNLGGEKTLTGGTLNTWYHVSISMTTSGTVKYYINGTLLGTDTSKTAISSDFNSLWKGWLGQPGATQTGSFRNGFVDEIAVFPSELTQANIQNLRIYPLTGTPSALTEKINSYSLERGIDFNQTYSLNPVVQGTNPTKTFTQNSSGNIVLQNTVSPIAGYGGSWLFTLSATTGPMSYFRNTTTTSNELLGSVDGDYSVGIWFKLNSLPTGNQTAFLLSYGSSASTEVGFSSTISGDTYTYPNVITISRAGGVIRSGTLSVDTWYYLAVIRTPGTTGTNFYVYLNGSLLDSGTHTGTGSTNPTSWMIGSTSGVTGMSGTYNVSNYYMAPSSVIDSTQITAIYNSTLSGDKTVTADVMTASSDTVTPTNSVTANVNLDAFGYASASSLSVDPTVEAIKQVDYAAEAATASGLINDVTVTTTSQVDYAASPLNASALLSGNNYAGKSIQDTSYLLNLRTINDTTNAAANSTVTIGSTYVDGSLTDKRSLLIRQTSGFPVYGSMVKVKIDPAHVTVTSTSDISPSNTFNIYVFTAAPTDWNTFTYANLPAKELISTSRLVDDGSSTQFYIDLTTAFNDSRAATYGVFIEHVGVPNISGTMNDNTIFSGSNMSHEFLYILTSEYVNKDINAAVMTASSDTVTPTVDTQKYVDIQDGIALVTATMVTPSVSTGTTSIINAAPCLATTLMADPIFRGDVIYPHDHAEAFGAFPVVSVSANMNATTNANPMTLGAEFVDPGYNIGETNVVEHFSASAAMGNHQVSYSNQVSASPMTASSTQVASTVATETKGIYLAPPMTARVRSVTPPAFNILTDDLWFNRLYAQQKANITGQRSFLHFFTETSDLLPGGTIESQAFTTVTPVATVQTGYDTTITPRGYVGYVDEQYRPAVNLKNLVLDYQKVNAAASVYATTTRGFTLETMIKTTKSNQIIFGGEWQSETGYQSKSSRFGLTDGKFYVMDSFRQISGSTPEISIYTYDQLNSAGLAPRLEIGKTNIADGQWHHVVIQMGYDTRVQVWIDGKLDLQKYNNVMAYPTQIGYNSADSRLSTDIFISAVSVNAQQFVGERDLTLNYYASINYTPIQPAPMLANATITEDNKGRGNKGRALMLYFWSTEAANKNTYGNGRAYQNQISHLRPNNYDQNVNGYFDIDTFFQLSTWPNSNAISFYDWDVFPIDVQGHYTSAMVKPESYDNPRVISNQGDISYTDYISDGFKDDLDNRRYIDLVKDIANLEDFDAIFFRNYPDQSAELDEFEREDPVDNYFQIKEKVIFENFLKSLREAVDTGISLFITNPQLAIDLGIVDRVEEVSDLSDTPSGTDSDTLSPVITHSNYPDNNQPENADTLYRYIDFHKNNYHRVVNTVPNLTDDESWTWKETVKYYVDGLIEFGGNDRWWDHYEYKPNGLAVGDEFLIPDLRERSSKYLAVPFANVKAGKVVTAFGANYYKGTTLTPNPYANYATTIAVSPGDVLNGTQVGGKIFVSFTEIINYNATINNIPQREYGEIALSTDEMIDYAYAEGTISLSEAISFKANPNNLNRRLEAGTITQTEFDQKSYWQLNGDDIISALTPYGDMQVQSVDSADGVVKGKSAKTRKNRKKTTTVNTGLPNFMISWGWVFPTVNLFVPSMTTRGLWWLSDRTAYDAGIQRPLAITAIAELPNPVITAQKILVKDVQAMLATATINETSNNDGNKRIVVLPMTATALITQYPKVVYAPALTATATLATGFRTITSAIDEVVLYVMHEDPILYIREDVIK